jgi:chemotaxis protein CheZ
MFRDKLSTNHVQKIVDFLQREKDGDVSLEDVMSLAEIMTKSLEGFFEHVDLAMSQELAGIAKDIQAMKKDIAELRPKDLQSNRIPQAGEELDAVVLETEAATDRIMAAVEAIQAEEPSGEEAYKEFITNHANEIFEACAFQDITGQRIRKVVETLNVIEDRVSRFAEKLRVEDAPVEKTEEDIRREENILHGPQKDGDGVSQDDIDALFD